DLRIACPFRRRALPAANFDVYANVNCDMVPPILLPAASPPAFGEAGARARACDRRTLMTTYKAPVADVLFLLNEVQGYERHANLAGFADAPDDMLEAILGEAARLAENVIHQLNRIGDTQGCVRHDDGSVTTPQGFRAAYDQYCAGGWIGLSIPADYG